MSFSFWLDFFYRKDAVLDGGVVEDGKVRSPLPSLMGTVVPGFFPFQLKSYDAKLVQIRRFRVAHWYRVLISPMRS
jgi:hypothetical protein